MAQKKPATVEEPVVETLKVAVTAARLNVRSRMTTDSEVVTIVNENDVLEVEKTKSVQWYKVNKPVSGFVKADFVKVV